MIIHVEFHFRQLLSIWCAAWNSSGSQSIFAYMAMHEQLSDTRPALVLVVAAGALDIVLIALVTSLSP